LYEHFEPPFASVDNSLTLLLVFLFAIHHPGEVRAFYSSICIGIKPWLLARFISLLQTQT
jgi:hypothetical protein